MRQYFTDEALLPGGWAGAVRIAVDAAGLIAAVEPGADADGAERLAGPLVPGMPNLHSHAFQRVMAGLAETAGAGEDSFWTWRELMYRLVGRLSPDDVQAIATQLYVELLKGGYTGVAEFHYLHHQPDGTPYDDPAELATRIAAAAETAGIGLTLLPVFYAHAGFGGTAPQPGQRRFIHGVDGFARLLDRIGQQLAGRSGMRAGMAFHSLRAATAEEIALLLPAAGSDQPIHIHVAEQQAEVDACLAWSGLRPIQWLYRHAPVDGRWCLVHATHAEPGEVAAIASSAAVVGLCPTTEANLGDGLFPAIDHLRAGGRFGIGSDSHVSVEPAEELRWLEYGQRLKTERRARLVLPDRPSVGGTLYAAALAGGAAAMGRKTGRLEVGARADLVVLDGAAARLAGCRGDAILDRWLFAGGAALVRDVMVGGRWVVRDGHHPAEEQAAAGFAAAARSLLQA